MTAWFHRKARRLMVATTLTLAVGLPMLACSGGGDVATDGTTTPDPVPAPKADDPAKKVVGTWRMVPPEEELRRLKVIDAALSGKPQKKEKLGSMTADEKALFNEWSGKKGAEAQAMKGQIRFSKNCQFTFTDSQVTVKFEDESFGPVNYSVVSATDNNTTVKFDPGLGNGTETHSITWESASKGVDLITAENGSTFFPLNVSKR